MVLSTLSAMSGSSPMAACRRPARSSLNGNFIDPIAAIGSTLETGNVAEKLFDDYFHYSEERLNALGTPRDVAAFLATTGLPTWCAPNAHFGPVGDQWAELPLRQVDTMSYVGLGEDRDDNLIALALEGGHIWALPASAPRIHVAANVQELSASLHAFQTCVNAAVAEDSDAFVQARIPLRHLESFVSWGRALNPDLVGCGSFWAQELLRNGLPPQSLDFSGARCPRCL